MITTLEQSIANSPLFAFARRRLSGAGDPEPERRRGEGRRDETAGIRFEGRSARVLLVEDDPLDRNIALGMLEGLSISADTVENGVEALAALERRQYGLVLMDCQMPLMDGYEATRRIRCLEGGARGVPIVAVTSNTSHGDREKCLEAGMDDYIAKPLGLASLLEALNRWLPENGEFAAHRSGR